MSCILISYAATLLLLMIVLMCVHRQQNLHNGLFQNHVSLNRIVIMPLSLIAVDLMGGLACCSFCEKRSGYSEHSSRMAYNSINLAQYDKVPLEKMFCYKQPRVPLMIHPHIRKNYSQDQLPIRQILETQLLSELHRSTCNHPALPRIDLILFYDLQTYSLTVSLLEGRSLASNTKTGTSDPYVTLSLLPQKEVIFRSKTCYKNSDPIFNESFTFCGISFEDITARTLFLKVFNESHHDLIGTARLRLHRLELHGAHISALLNEIDDNDDEALPVDKKGSIQLLLWYNPSVNILSGLIIKAIHLEKKSILGISDPYIVMRLSHKEETIKKWQSKVLKKTFSPEFNQEFTFDLAEANIENTILHLVVKDKERFSKDDVMGFVDFGLSVEHESGCRHWKEIIDNPFTRITHWHFLE